MREVANHMKEMAAHKLHEAFMRGVKGSKLFKVTSQPSPKRGHRFIADFKM